MHKNSHFDNNTTQYPLIVSPNQSWGGFFQTHDVMPTGKIRCSNESLKTSPLAQYHTSSKRRARSCLFGYLLTLTAGVKHQPRANCKSTRCLFFQYTPIRTLEPSPLFSLLCTIEKPIHKKYIYLPEESLPKGSSRIFFLSGGPRWRLFKSAMGDKLSGCGTFTPRKIQAGSHPKPRR